MKDYQVKSLTSCKLPETVYRQALWAVKDLPRMKERLLELEEMLVIGMVVVEAVDGMVEPLEAVVFYLVVGDLVLHLQKAIII